MMNRKAAHNYILFLLYLMLLSCSTPKILNISWSEKPHLFTAHFNYARNGYQEITIADSVKVEDMFDLSGLPVATPLVYSNTLISVTYNGYLYFMDTDNLKKKAKKQISDGIGTSPTVLETLLYIPSDLGDFGLTVYNSRTAKIVWELESLLSRSSPIISNGQIFHASINGKVTSFEEKFHKQIWSVEINDNILNDMALYEDNLIIASQNGIVKNYNPQKGSLNWSLKLHTAVYASPVIDNQSVFIAGFSGEIIKISLKSGNIEESYNSDVPVYFTPSLDKNTLFVPLANGTLLSLDKNTLKQNWNSILEGPFSESVLVTANKIVAGTAARKLYVLNKVDGSVAQCIELAGRPHSQPVIYENKLYLSYEPDILITFSLNRGNNAP